MEHTVNMPLVKTPRWAWVSLFISVLLVAALGTLAILATTQHKVSLFGQVWMPYTSSELVMVEDSTCSDCGNQEIAKNLPGAISPAATLRQVSLDSAEGQKMIDEYKITAVPYIILPANLTNNKDFGKMESMLSKHSDGTFGLSAMTLQAPKPKILHTPTVTDADATFGKKDAPVTIIVFSDFQCPFCAKALTTVHQIQKTYGDSIRMVFKHLPLESIHPQARGAAAAAICAQKEGKFWEMHDLMFENQKALSKSDLTQYAAQLKLDSKAFATCLDAKETQNQIDADVKEAEKYGLSGTPAFFVGDQLLAGAYPFEEFQKIIEQKLKK